MQPDRPADTQASPAQDGGAARLDDVADSYLSTDEILAHPRFDAAFDCLMDGIATLYGGDMLLIRKLMEYHRAVAFMMAVSLDACQEPDRPETWLTVERLREALVQMQVTSARRIADLVISMEQDGLLVTARAASDRRVRILQASELARALDRDWLKVFHRPLVLLDPAPRYDAALAEDPGYQKAHRRAGLRTLAIAGKIVKSNPAADYFLKSTAGIRIVANLFQVLRSSPDRRTPPGFYSYAAARCAVSRVHVRKVLEGAEALGLVTLSEPRGLFVEARPELYEAMHLWVAQSLSATDLVCALASASGANE